MDDDNVLSTRCVIAGGGPAGMMAGFLLARAGVDVIVLEKHQDFLHAQFTLISRIGEERYTLLNSDPAPDQEH